jgi:uncharacterized SAM-binding protein YcdF (DUF218 family)
MKPRRLFSLLPIALMLTGILLGIAILSPRIDLLSRLIFVQPAPQKADVIVVFSAGKLDNCQAHPNLLRREFHGAKLLKKGYSRSEKLILTGLYTKPEVSGITPEACRVKFSHLLDIPLESLILDNFADDTRENALHSKAIMAKKGWETALLVTSKSHLLRAKMTFEKQGVKVYPDSVPDHPPLGTAWFDGNRQALLYRFIYEYGALMKYKWYGYI